MSYAILPALIPDIEKVYDAYFSAFKGDLMGDIMVKLLFPGGVEGEEFRKAHAAGTLAWWHQSKVQYTYKCVDTETGEIVGMALGDIYLNERTEEERAFQGVGWLEGEQREKAEAVLKPLHDAREKLFGGRKYVYVHVIAIDPKFQGRKAGALWCQWGKQLSDSLGLPLYFEASPSTYKLYEKMGYETLEDTIVHKAAVFGTPKDIEVPLMVNMPVAAAGLTFKEWRAADYPSFSAVRKAKAAAAAAAAVGAPAVVASAAADKTEAKVAEVAVEVKEVVA
ncbi:hypothetical protein BN1723_003064 [Verticillium longisporum]|uniref:Uncharacterized protein n=1 Tax=Verticillium longisporum TaxID=100787 RepID=A0A0G4LPR2_VERLO|nr:hypothetical protein BN1723_003064 [Verticillium longisporum]